ncbi:hypothetical protein [Pseudoalteromonas sp. T1lg22]|uniref:hypothetical protein n=1 Tax=Pseudoalteromonas sp. T1lg22 TaxID=2077096 RepID=UPI000CF6C719|nr:hypothetical protein [Pseudoalteromonas sp. T1lg22]
MPDPTPVTGPAAETVDSHLSTLQFCTTGVGTVDAFLPGLDIIPQINSGKVYEDDTDIAAAHRSYSEKALPEDQDWELAFRHKPGIAEQKSFTDLVKAGTPISIKVTRASGEVQDAVFIPHDYYSGESGKDSGKQMFACIGKLQQVQFTTLAAV